MAYKIIFLIAFLVASVLGQVRHDVEPEQPEFKHHKPSHDPYYQRPKYDFQYRVEDDYYGDYKEHKESRDGDKTEGFYWVVEPDGYERRVDYHVKGKSGFVAKVVRTPTNYRIVYPSPPVDFQERKQPK